MPTSTQFLRQAIERGERYDAIVLDPPKFAPTAAHAERAARAYKDINRLAFKLLAPGGLLYTFSCSGGVSADLFHKIVAGAGLDAGIDGDIHARLGRRARSPDDGDLSRRRVPEGAGDRQALSVSTVRTRALAPGRPTIRR